MSAQHTPGPWSVNPKAALIDAPDGESICLLRWPTTVRTEVETKANATLIAAAPDLLEALEACLKIIGRPNDDPNMLWASDDEINSAVRLAVAAIKKAKGEQCATEPEPKITEVFSKERKVNVHQVSSITVTRKEGRL